MAEPIRMCALPVEPPAAPDSIGICSDLCHAAITIAGGQVARMEDLVA